MKIKKVKFPIDKFEDLIKNITGTNLDKWINFWEQDKEVFNIISGFYGKNLSYDWLWGVVLPFLSDIYYLEKSSFSKPLIGLSALPGTGKTTLGLLIEKLALRMNINVSVVSMDDFYLPFIEMEEAIKGNPWRVSRGFPGSHSVNLIENRILDWKNTGKFNYPVFDKSLRNGLGDRESWKTTFPEILVIEGWFLGIKPLNRNYMINDLNEYNLLPDEKSYRLKIQNNLNNYLKIWNLIDKIWQIKPNDFLYMNKWKSNQEAQMFKIKGNALKDNELINFIRMLNYSIPQESFNVINSNYKIVLGQEREVIFAGLNNSID